MQGAAHDLLRGADTGTLQALMVQLKARFPDKLEASVLANIVGDFAGMPTIMKRLAFVAAVLAVSATACSKSEQAKTDTTPPAMAPAPAPAPTAADTGMKMMDTAMKKMDTAMKKMDTTKKKP